MLDHHGGQEQQRECRHERVGGEERQDDAPAARRDRPFSPDPAEQQNEGERRHQQLEDLVREPVGVEAVEEERGAEEGERRGEPGGPEQNERRGEDDTQDEGVPGSCAGGVKRVAPRGEVREQEEEREEKAERLEDPSHGETVRRAHHRGRHHAGAYQVARVVVWPFQRVCPAPNRLRLSFSPPPRRPRKRGASSSPASAPESPSPTWPACAVRVSLRSGAGALTSVLVSGPVGELALFEDYLVVLAFLVPGAQRERQVAGEPASPLGVWHFARSVFRVAGGLAAGVAALASAWLRAGRLGGRPFVPQRVGSRARCLYLKPTLSFGASVGGSVAHVAGVANALARAGIAVRLLSAHEQPLIAPPMRPAGRLTALPDLLPLRGEPAPLPGCVPACRS